MKKDDKRVLKGRETKERLLRAAVTLFSQQGYDGVSIRDITTAAGVPKSLYYHYFNSKDEILQHLIRLYDLQVSAPPEQLAEQSSPPQALEEAGRRVFRQVSAQQDILKIILLEALKNEGVLNALLDKFDQVEQGFTALMPASLREKYTRRELAVFILFFRFFPEILFTLTRGAVARHYAVSEEGLAEDFLKSLLQFPTIPSQGE